MNKEIKDYLHLYLGAKMLVEIIDHEGYNWSKPRETAIDAHALSELYRTVWRNPTPILRPLSDMTEEVAVCVAKLIYSPNGTDYVFSFQPYDAKMYEDAAELVRVRFKGAVFADKIENLMVEIYKDFSCYSFYCREDGAHSLPMRNQHEITRYLLSKHFDLFGLIEAGLALDKTKINSQTLSP